MGVGEQVKVTRVLLNSYFAISRAALANTVPKAVVHFLVNSIGRGLQQHLIGALYRENMFDPLLQEARNAPPVPAVNWTAHVFD